MDSDSDTYPSLDPQSLQYPWISVPALGSESVFGNVNKPSTSFTSIFSGSLPIGEFIGLTESTPFGQFFLDSCFFFCVKERVLAHPSPPSGVGVPLMVYSHWLSPGLGQGQGPGPILYRNHSHWLCLVPGLDT